MLRAGRRKYLVCAIEKTLSGDLGNVVLGIGPNLLLKDLHLRFKDRYRRCRALQLIAHLFMLISSYAISKLPLYGF